MSVRRASDDRYWKEQGESFASYYQAPRALSPKGLVTRFLEARGGVLDALCDFPREARVLDLGCGSGAHLPKLLPRCRLLVGADYSERMLRLARREAPARPGGGPGPPAGLVAADAHALPFRAASFEAVVSLGLVDYVRSPAAVLAECRRVLAPGGRLLVSAPKTPSAFGWLRTAPGNLLKKTLFDLPPVVNVFDRLGLEHLLREAGFEPEALAAVWTTMWVVRARRSSDPT